MWILGTRMEFEWQLVCAFVEWLQQKKKRLLIMLKFSYANNIHLRYELFSLGDDEDKVDRPLSWRRSQKSSQNSEVGGLHGTSSEIFITPLVNLMEKILCKKRRKINAGVWHCRRYKRHRHKPTSAVRHCLSIHSDVASHLSKKGDNFGPSSRK